jgi:hypothetical protein
MQAFINGKWVTVGDVIPSGVVTEFAGTSAPSDWLMCDGSLVSRTVYA